MALVPSPGFCLVQGQLQDSVALIDRGFAYGDGLFETMRFRLGKIPAWPLHLNRLQRGTQALQIDISWQLLEQQLSQALDIAVKNGISDGVLKLVVTRGRGGEGYRLPVPSEPTLAFIGRPYRPMALLDGTGAVALKSCDYRLAHNPVLAEIKHLNRLEHVLAAASVSLASCEQGLVFDRCGRMIETLHHNIFLVTDGRLRTPNLSQCGVAGVVRRKILETLGPSLNLPVAVEHLESRDLEAADEVFICNGVHGVTPVHQWNDARWHTGPVTQAVTQALAREWNNLYGR